MNHAHRQSSLSFSWSANVGQERSQVSSTFDVFGSRDLQVFTEATPEKRHMSSILWETICRPRISPTFFTDNRLSSATDILEPSSASSFHLVVLNALHMSMLINAQNSWRLLAPLFCSSRDVHHCQDGVYCGDAFLKSDLALQETVLANHVTLYSLQNHFLQKLPQFIQKIYRSIGWGILHRFLSFLEKG